jgi:hypothetical protein
MPSQNVLSSMLDQNLYFQIEKQSGHIFAVLVSFAPFLILSSFSLFLTFSLQENQSTLPLSLSLSRPPPLTYTHTFKYVVQSYKGRC